jgi:membrane associated rhomboid family serine protease
MRTPKNLQTAVTVVAILWFVYFINMILPVDFWTYGIRPRSLHGIWGIVLAPLLHANLKHLIANTSALFVLLLVSLSFSRILTFTAILIIIAVGGSLVWLFGRGNAIYIGASGIIFGLIGFLMFIGVFRREWIALVVSVAICIFYSGALLSLLVIAPGTSWSGHVYGFISGALTAWWTKDKKGK